MGTETTSKTVHTCDRCGKQHVGESLPGGPTNCWATLRFIQNGAFDFQGASWGERVPQPILLCHECADDMADFLNQKRGAKKMAAVVDAVRSLTDPEDNLACIPEGPERKELETAYRDCEGIS